MYGNYVTASDGVASYNACNGMHRMYVDSSPKAWYQVWNRDRNGEGYDERYCSMVLKRWGG